MDDAVGEIDGVEARVDSFEREHGFIELVLEEGVYHFDLGGEVDAVAGG